MCTLRRGVPLRAHALPTPSGRRIWCPAPFHGAIGEFRLSISTESVRLSTFFPYWSSVGWTREAPCSAVGRRGPLRDAARISGPLDSTPSAMPGACGSRLHRVVALVTRGRCAAPDPLSGGEVVPRLSFPVKLAFPPLRFRSASVRSAGSVLALFFRPTDAPLVCPLTPPVLLEGRRVWRLPLTNSDLRLPAANHVISLRP